MFVKEPKFVPSPEGQATCPIWVQLLWHPAERGQVYSVKHGPEGKRFTAYYDWDFCWYKVGEPVDGQREVLEQIRHFLDLHYVTRI